MRKLFANANNTQACNKPSFSCFNNVCLTDAALAVSVSFYALVRVIIARISIIAMLILVLRQNNSTARVEVAAV